MDHLREKGFTVEGRDVVDLRAVKRKHGVPADLILRLLRERPNVLGLGVPGMPPGSPGMDAPGTLTQRYQVFTFDRNGKTGVFATR